MAFEFHKGGLSNLIGRALVNLAQRTLGGVAFVNLVLVADPCMARDAGHGGNYVTYSSPSQKYPLSTLGYSVTNNAWGVKNLTEGADYSTSMRFDPTAGSAVSFSWKYPQNVGRVFGYPHIGYDPRAASVSSTQAANIVGLVANYNVQLSDAANSTVAFDFWFNSRPNGAWETTSIELLVEVHPTSRPSMRANIVAHLRRLFRAQPEPNPPLLLIGEGFSGATVHVSNMKEAGASWKFIDVKMPEDVWSGKLSLAHVIKELIWNGVMTGEEYLTSLQFGSEVLGGVGGLEVKNLSYEWTAKPTSFGTSGDDTFNMAGGGGNHVVGNGGIDTAIYPGPHASYLIKSDAAKIFVIKDNDISTLDTLGGVSLVRFSDGTFDTTTGQFNPKRGD